jgi:hypothetical protein
MKMTAFWDTAAIIVLIMEAVSTFETSVSFCEVGFEVLTAVSKKMAVFWVVAPCNLVEIYQRFRRSCCLHHQGNERLHSSTAQKAGIFIDE